MLIVKARAGKRVLSRVYWQELGNVLEEAQGISVPLNFGTHWAYTFNNLLFMLGQCNEYIYIYKNY